MERRIYKPSLVQQMLQAGGALIVTSDQEMEMLAQNPTARVRAFDGCIADIVEKLSGYDAALAQVAYDFFFGGDRREYFPTSPQCIQAFSQLCGLAQRAGVGFGASVLSPLDLGPAYFREKGRGGITHQFQEAERQPDGIFEVPMRVQKQWFHNKGPAKLAVRSVHVYAFTEEPVGFGGYYTVDPDQIEDVSDGAELVVDESSYHKTGAGYATVHGVVRGKAHTHRHHNRVMAVIRYDVEEMDYFHPDALNFLTQMLDSHKAAGIDYRGFYSDEMHIQFDWDLQHHFGLTEIATRYITPGLIAAYCRAHGERYRNFEKYLIYFAFAQHRFHPHNGEPEMSQHVFGPSTHEIAATWKFRRDYYRLLEDQVVDLFIKAKEYGENLFGHRPIWTRAHATWQESPTCDHVNAAWAPADAPISRYDYTPAYDWSSSIRENVSACYDYFRWGDYLTGMGTDHPEGGYIDRNYYGAALACSFGNFNQVPYGYWGHWGSPAPVSERMEDLAAAMGLAGQRRHCGFVQGWQHRKTPVLALYPLDLNSVQERFGSWMVQYGYCDYLTEEKFAEWARISPNGRVKIKDREYSTVVVLFEPMILKTTLRKLRQLVERGGRLVWTGPPPDVYHEGGDPAVYDFMRLFGLGGLQSAVGGFDAENQSIIFRNSLRKVPDFRVPTHLLPDLVYPAEVTGDTEAVATLGKGRGAPVIGTLRQTRAGGTLLYFGARPRDDQSGSTSDAPRTLFYLLSALGAYTDAGEGWAETVSNTSPLFVAESPNGAVSLAHHTYQVVENWPGGFFRPKDEEFDASVLPPTHLSLQNDKLGPYRISYEGERFLSFLYRDSQLIGFSGELTQGIRVNGRSFKFSNEPITLTFAPLPEKSLAQKVERAWFLYVLGTIPNAGVTIRLPYEISEVEWWVTDPKGNGRGKPERIAMRRRGRIAEIVVPPDKQGVPLYLFYGSSPF